MPVVRMHYEKSTTISGIYSASENEDVAQCRPDEGENFLSIANENIAPPYPHLGPSSKYSRLL